MPITRTSGWDSRPTGDAFSADASGSGSSGRGRPSDLSFLAELARAVIHSLESRGASSSALDLGGRPASSVAQRVTTQAAPSTALGALAVPPEPRIRTGSVSGLAPTLSVDGLTGVGQVDAPGWRARDPSLTLPVNGAGTHVSRRRHAVGEPLSPVDGGPAGGRPGAPLTRGNRGYLPQRAVNGEGVQASRPPRGDREGLAAGPATAANPSGPRSAPAGDAPDAAPPQSLAAMRPAAVAVSRDPSERALPLPAHDSTMALDPTAAAPQSLPAYPRPPGDSGRGVHWIPTLHSDPAVVDRFVAEAKKMNVSWVVFLNDGSNVGQNDYLVQQLVANHVEPVMRIYTSHGQPIDGDLTGMVRHYVNLGVHYFLPYNEPNLPDENPDGNVSVDGYVNRWTAAARQILSGGGLPGLGALAPGAPVDDVAFLRSTIEKIRQNGAADLLNRAWIGVHNYTFNRPIDYHDDSNGFLKFQWYDQVARQELGRSLPIISTEGGPRLGDDQDHRFPAVDEKRRDYLATETFHYLDSREPYFFAQTQWVLANEAGGGHDSAWEKDALFQEDGSPTQLAQELRTQEVTA